jgi:hypothetical protein
VVTVTRREPRINGAVGWHVLLTVAAERNAMAINNDCPYHKNGTCHNTGIDPLTQELNTSAQRRLTRFLLGILLLKPSISLILYMREKPTNVTIIISVY